MKEEILELLKNSDIKTSDLYDIVTNKPNKDIIILKNYLKDISTESKKILQKLGIISSDNIDKELEQLNEQNKKIKNIIENIQNKKYLDNEQKELFKSLVSSYKNETNLLKPIIETFNTDNKAITKILSAIQNSIDDTTKINIIEKTKFSNEVDNIIKEYKSTGVLTDEILVSIKDLIDRMDKYTNENGKVFDIQEKEKIQELIDNEIKANIKQFQYDLLLNEALKTIDKSKQEKLLSGEIPLSEANISSIPDIDNYFKESFILNKRLLDIIDGKTTQEQKELLEDLLKQYNENIINKETFIKELRYIFDEKVSKLLEEEIDKINELVESNELTNKQKILNEKRIDLLNEATEKLSEISDSIEVKENESILAGITQASDIEQVSYQTTSKLLDKIFGEGVISEKFFKKISKILKLDKLASILLRGGKGFFSKLLSVVSKPLTMASASLLPTVAKGATSGLSALGGLASSAGSFLVSNPIGWAVLGTTAVAGAGYAYYKYKYGKDKELIDALEQQGIVDYNLLGDSKIKNWSAIFALPKKDIDTLVHFNDWDEKTTVMLRALSKVPEDARRAIGQLIQNNEVIIKDGKLHFTEKAIADLFAMGVSKDDLRPLMASIDETRNLLKEQKILDKYYSQGLTSLPDLVMATKLPLPVVKDYLESKNISQSKATIDYSHRKTSTEKEANINENKEVIIQNNIMNNTIERKVDKSLDFLNYKL